MVGGGVIAAFALALASFNLAWPVQFLAFTVLGFGFYTMHASIQVQATELSSASRGAAMSMHSFFFFMGHAGGPVLYGLGFVSFGSAVTLTIAAMITMAIGLVTARLLRERTDG
jgi:predicted MFS family arabinose efflux permease